MMNSNSVRVVRTSLDVNIIPPAPKCVIEIDEYRLKRDDKQNCIYIKLPNKVNVDEYINSFKDTCSLQSLLQRCSLMPTEQKIRFLHQCEDGVSADLTNVPKDGTEAFMMLSEISRQYPDLVKRFSSGESFDSILKSIVTPDSPANNDSIVSGGEDNGKE